MALTQLAADLVLMVVLAVVLQKHKSAFQRSVLDHMLRLPYPPRLTFLVAQMP